MFFWSFLGKTQLKWRAQRLNFFSATFFWLFFSFSGFIFPSSFLVSHCVSAFCVVWKKQEQVYFCVCVCVCVCVLAKNKKKKRTKRKKSLKENKLFSCAGQGSPSFTPMVLSHPSGTLEKKKKEKKLKKRKKFKRKAFFLCRAGITIFHTYGSFPSFWHTCL